VSALKAKKIAGVALDVYDVEPLPVDHVLRTLDNVLATPHVGYVTEETYKVFYGDTVRAIEGWAKFLNLIFKTGI
jgi:phosphoglycerate dehydrogenase-like enzyme